jgi:glycosyltransferase involved in cell wall biosynthesis
MNKLEELQDLSDVLIIFAVERLCLGGVRTIISHLTEAAAAVGASVCIATNVVPDPIYHDNAQVIKLGIGLQGVSKYITLAASLIPLKLLRTIRQARRSRRRVVLHLNSPYPTVSATVLIAKLMLRAPLIYTIHANRTHIPSWAWLIERIIFKFADTVVTELPASVSDLRGIRVGRPNRIVNIDFGVSEAVTTRKWIPHERHAFRFVSVARLDKNRYVDRLLIAFSIATREVLSRPLEFVVIGSGPEHDALQSLVLQRNLEQMVVFLPAMPEWAIQDKLIEADCFVTLAAGGQVGMAGKIAAGVGIPIVALELSESVSEFTAIDEEKLARLMISAARMTREQQEMAGKVLQKRLFHSVSEMNKSYLSEFSRATCTFSE